MKQTFFNFSKVPTSKQMTFWKNRPKGSFTTGQLSSSTQHSHLNKTLSMCRGLSTNSKGEAKFLTPLDKPKDIKSRIPRKSQSNLIRKSTISVKLFPAVKPITLTSLLSKEEYVKCQTKDFPNDSVTNFALLLLNPLTYELIGRSLYALLLLALKTDPSLILTSCLTPTMIMREDERMPPGYPGFLPFNQAIFSKSIRRFLSGVSLKEDLCMGHVTTWYHCQLNNLNYVQELNHIKNCLEANKQLTKFQSELLQNIITTQKNRQPALDYLPYGTKNHFIRQNIVQHAVDYAINNPGKLVSLTPVFSSVLTKIHGLGTGNMMGIVSNKKGEINYFDPNRGEYVLQDANQAKIIISSSLAHDYAWRCPSLGSHTTKESLEITSPPSKCL